MSGLPDDEPPEDGWPAAPCSNSLELVSVPEDDCFIAAMLTAAGVVEGIHKDNPSNEEKQIWSAANATVINQVRQEMASVIFTIHTGATQAWGEEAMNKLFGDLHFNKNRWRKIVAQVAPHNPWQPGTWGGDIELAVVAWLLEVNLHVLTRTDESALDKRSVRSFHFDGSAKMFLHLTGNMQPLLNTDLGDENNSGDVLPQMDNFVTVDVPQLVEEVKSPCFFEILGFSARDFDVLDEKLDIVIAKDQLQRKVGSTRVRQNVFVLYNGVNHYDAILCRP
jgi:hypothetical protein